MPVQDILNPFTPDPGSELDAAVARQGQDNSLRNQAPEYTQQLGGLNVGVGPEQYTGSGGQTYRRSPLSRQQTAQLAFRQAYDGAQEQRKQARYLRDATALAKQFGDGRLSEDSYSKASEQIILHAGRDSKAATILLGQQQERAIADQKRISELAEPLGLPPQLLKINPKTNDVMLNKDSTDIVSYVSQLETEKATRQFHKESNEAKNRKAILDNLTARENQLIRMIGQNDKAEIASPKLHAELNKIWAEQWKLRGEAPVQFSTPTEARALAPQNAPSFKDGAEATAAWNAGTFNGGPATIDGKPGLVDSNGKFHRSQ